MIDRYGLYMRAALFSAIRTFFNDQGFVEVDTPIRQPVIIPEATIVPLRADSQYLHTSPELSMKRLLTVLEEDIFQLCPCFRKGEVGRLHGEEFWMLEWYRHGCDYEKLMEDCQALVRFIAQELEGERHLRGGKEPVFSGILLGDGDWPRITVADGFARYSPISLEQAIAENSFDELLVEYVEPRLGLKRPEILYDYPVELGSLARTKPGNPALAERFELYMKGVELANGFSELVNAEEQRHRFEAEIKIIEERRGENMVMPERFLADLETLGPTAGIALGVDRLLMLALGRESLDHCVTFAREDLV